LHAKIPQASGASRNERSVVVKKKTAAVEKTHGSAQSPLSVHPDNHRYFVYCGNPLVLVTSDQHYGAVINRDFDYAAFLSTLKSRNLNFTRIYPGAYIERKEDFTPGNNLGPLEGRQILPWARTTATGAHPVLGGFKYDLDTWDPDYFNRLRDFCAKARNAGIIVEICYFNGMYEDRWQFQAMHHSNNIQGIGTCGWDMVQSVTADPRLLACQVKYVAEIARRLNDFDNVIFHVCDEPWMCRLPPAIFGAWMDRLIEAYRDAEKDLPRKHLLGQTVDWKMRDNEADFSADSRIHYIDIEYARGAEDLRNEYVHEKPIVYIESEFYPYSFTGDRTAASRVEAWEFMINGCGGFMHLNALFTAANPTATGAENDGLLGEFTKLKAFMESFDFVAMRRDDGFVAGGLPEGAFSAALSEPGRQYAFFIHHSAYRDPPPRPDADGSFRHSYVVTSGRYRETFSFEFPEGRYLAEWVNPAAGTTVQSDTFEHAGGVRAMAAPEYTIDIALRMKKI
jgi:hypothetical protein